MKELRKKNTWLFILQISIGFKTVTLDELNVKEQV